MNVNKYFHNVPKDVNILDDSKRKSEFVKIMIQTLSDMGYSDTANKLTDESGIKLESDHLSDFRHKILDAEWDQAFELLPSLEMGEEQNERAKFLINEQRYIELILKKNYSEALNLLRNELTGNCKDHERLHRLASIMICQSPEDVASKLNRKVDVEQSRQNLLADIQANCKPTNMISQNRMSRLLYQAVSYQAIEDKYHFKLDKNFSLLEDYQTQMPQVPIRAIRSLKDQNEEVWQVKWSANGKYLASIAKAYDLSIQEFNPEDYTFKLKFKKEKIHDKEINCFNWSPDNKKILTASADKRIKVFDVETGQLKVTVQGHIDIICSAVWLPDSQQFLSGGIDTQLILWNMNGDQVTQIATPRLLELLISSDGKYVYAICTGTPRVIVTDLQKKQEVHQIKEKNTICAAAISRDDQYLIVNTSHIDPEIHLWSLKNYELVQTYIGHFQEKYLIRCCFGGIGDQFLACGGEDATVKIWHRNCRDPVAILTGHNLTTNAVSWNPEHPEILATASDDQSIRIWATEDVYQKIKDTVTIEDDKNGEMISEENEQNLEELPHLFEEDEEEEDDDDSDQND